MWIAVAAHAALTLSGLGRASATLALATDLSYVAMSVVTAVLIGLRVAPQTAGGRFPAHEGITGAALREGRMRNVPRSGLDPDAVVVTGTEEVPEALVCCPMSAHGEPLGALNVYRSGAWAPFSRAEAEVIEHFAAVVSLALRRDARDQAVDGSTPRTAA